MQPHSTSSAAAAAASRTDRFYDDEAEARRDVRTKLIAFYRKYNAERLPDIDKILFSFHGREDELFEQLLKKYAPYGDRDLHLKALPGHEKTEDPPTPPPPAHSPPPEKHRGGDDDDDGAVTSRGDAAHNNNNSSSMAQRRAKRSSRVSFGRGHGAPNGGDDEDDDDESSSNRVAATSSPEKAVTDAQRRLGEDFFPERPRTKSLVEVTDATLQQAHAELQRLSKSLFSMDPREFQNLLSDFVDVSCKLASLEAQDEDDEVLDRLDDDIQSKQNAIVGVITQLQHAVRGFMSIAENVIEYSRQQSNLQHMRAERDSIAEKRRRVGMDDSPEDARRSGGGGGAPARYAVSEYDKHYQQQLQKPKAHNLYGDSSTGVGGGPADKASPGRGSAAGNASASMAAVSSSTKVVFDVFPLGGERNVVSSVILNEASAGDVIVLHPGEYRENLVVQTDIEIRCALAVSSEASQKETESRDAVVIVPADTSTPALQVVGDGICKLSGIVFRRPTDDRAALLAMHESSSVTARGSPSRYGGGTAGRGHAAVSAFLAANAAVPSVPLISVSGQGQLSMREACCVGGGGGIVALGHAQVRLNHCTFRRCSFSAIYVKDAAFASVMGTSFVECDTGLRVRDAAFSMELCELRDCRRDSVVLHGPAKGIVAKTKFNGTEDNAALLSPSSELVLSHCLVKGCRKHGVYAPIGADFAIIGCTFEECALGDSSRQPPLESVLAARHNIGHAS